MLIRKAEFVVSAVSPAQYPQDGLPEIALAGRSNVGKSSLINRVLGRRNLARTGNTPGKTRSLNFYRVNDAWYFVDLPGYGYAKVSKQVKASWGELMDTYFSARAVLRAVIHIVDIRHEPSAQDQEMFNFLNCMNIPTLLVATKADKIARGQWAKHLAVIAKTLDIPDWRLILPFSAQDGTGVDELRRSLQEILAPDEQGPPG